MMDYERDMDWVYRLRYLETEIQVLSKRRLEYERDRDYILRACSTPPITKKPDINIFEIIEEIVLVFCVLTVLFLCALSSGKAIIVLCIGVALFIAYFVYIFWKISRSRIYYRQDVAEDMKQREADKQAVLKRIQKINIEIWELASERDRLYSESHIPEKYRNIRCIYYIHDMVVNNGLRIVDAIVGFEQDKFEDIVEKYDEVIEAECRKQEKLINIQ